MMQRPLLTAFLIASIAILANGQAPASDAQASPAPLGTPIATPIATDRPSVTDSSVVVPLGRVQVENGFARTVTQGQGTYDVPEMLLRIGAASKTELRLTVPDYLRQPGVVSGLGDLALGLKQQLGPVRSFDVSLVLTLSLPTGAAAISSHGYDPSLQAPWSRALSSNWTAAGMVSVYWPTVQGRRNVTGETTFLIDRQLTKEWDAFAEFAGDFPEQGGPRHILHAGTSYKLTPQQQIDLHLGVGLSSSAADHFIGVGYSFRFQAFAHRRP
jgi:hypothetical protein